MRMYTSINSHARMACIRGVGKDTQLIPLNVAPMDLPLWICHNMESDLSEWTLMSGVVGCTESRRQPGFDIAAV